MKNDICVSLLRKEKASVTFHKLWVKVASQLRINYNLGLSLKDNAHSQLPIAVSSVSSSSKAPIVNPAPAVDPVSINEVALELKALLLFLLERV